MRPTINRHKVKLDEYAFALSLAHDRVSRWTGSGHNAPGVHWSSLK
ncbi:MAG: hypothetical protein HC795_16340 [Coleofasciculaceae cyanobacterium RL_1_1]|nr:hypothetical protein [Coleofasciculaceae cyanobacterium RL_1_1]